MDVCNACFKEVRWSAKEPSRDCNEEDCSYTGCGKNGGMGRFVHMGRDCGNFKWALGGLERET